MTASILASAVALGFFASLHCAFMCGPLAVAGCSVPERRGRAAMGYFAGRLVSYALMGAVFGSAGHRAAHLFSATGLQQGLLFAVAALAFARGLQLLLQHRRGALVAIGPVRAPPAVTRLAAALVPRRAFPLGLATGVLPCGLLAGGWALAASTAQPLDGALVMAAFSLATAPALAGALAAALPLARLRRRWSPAWQGALFCALGVFISVRPLLDRIAHAAHPHVH